MARYVSPAELVGGRELHVKRSWRSILGYLVTTLIGFLIVYLLIRAFGSYRVPTEVPVIRSLSVHWLLLLPTGLLIETFRKYHDDLYVFEEQKVTHRGGRLSLNYAVPVIYYSDVRSISVRQSVWGRMFNYGTVEVSTAAQADIEMCIEGVCSPDEIAQLVDELRVLNRKKVLDNIKKKSEPKARSAITEEPESSTKAVVGAE